MVDDALCEERSGFLLVLLVGCAGEEAALEFLLGVVKFHDNEAINVLRVVNFFGIGQAGLFQNPVVVLVFGSLLHSQHITRAKHGHTEVVFDVADGGIGCKRAVWDVDDVPLAHFFLHLRREDIVEFVEHDGFVDHATNNAS